jgi:peptidoglycan-associated lipoprotein
MSTLHYSAIALAGALVLSACGSKPLAPVESASGTAPATSASTTKPATPPAATAQAAPQAKAVPAHLDPASIISKERSVYFELDAYGVDTKFMPIVQAHGQYLAANPALSIRVEGHADERGGTEYNLALGQKRADAVVKVLKTYGVKDSQLEAVSFGKEKPKAQGHDEAAWAQNRRVDLAYPNK